MPFAISTALLSKKNDTDNLRYQSFGSLSNKILRREIVVFVVGKAFF